MEESVKKALIELLAEFVEENDILLPNDVILDENLRMIGSNALFDSMQLVQFIVEVENLLEDKFGIEIELTSEKAMSRRTSPFISINTLIKFIFDEL